MPPTSETISATTIASAAARISSVTTHQEIRDRYSDATAGASTTLLATRIRTRKVDAVEPRPRSSRSISVVRMPTVTIIDASRAVGQQQRQVLGAAGGREGHRADPEVLQPFQTGRVAVGVRGDDHLGAAAQRLGVDRSPGCR